MSIIHMMKSKSGSIRKYLKRSINLFGPKTKKKTNFIYLFILYLLFIQLVEKSQHKVSLSTQQSSFSSPQKWTHIYAPIL
jgi:hypothetical protein